MSCFKFCFLLLVLAPNVRGACVQTDVEDSVLSCEPVFYASDLARADSRLIIDCKDGDLGHLDVFALHDLGLMHLELIECNVDNARSKEVLVSLMSGLHSLSLSSTVLSSFLLPPTLTTLKIVQSGVSALDLALLCRLRSLELAHNAVMAIDDLEWCHVESQLAHLDFSYNSISSLRQRDFDSRLSHLRQLNVSHNFVDVIEDEALVNLVELRQLDLSHNKLAALPYKLFRTNTRLETLRLEHNFISFLSPNTFSPLSKSLLGMNLSSNILSSLDAFEGLQQLQMLDLSRNRIAHFDVLSPRSTMLEMLSLEHNELKYLGPDAFRAAKNLLSLNLADNKLRDVAIDAGISPRLLHLDLSRNDLSRLPLIMKSLRHLRTLLLSNNLLSKKSLEGFFDAMHNLQVLDLSYNRLSDIDGLLTRQSELLELDLGHNDLSWFDYGSLPPSVQKLSLSYNDLRELSNFFCNRQQYQLRHLDVRHNRVSRIDECSLVPSLRRVDLRHNCVSVIEKKAFAGLKRIRKIDLRHNCIKQLQPTALALRNDEQMDPKSPFWLASNPFNCDCGLEWLQNHGQNSVADINDISCFPRQLGGSKDVHSNKISLSQAKLLCTYESHCFTLCECCDFFACDCRMQCPANCVCYRDSTWTENIVDCSAIDADLVPAFIPMKATSVHLDKNKLYYLNDTDIFIGRNNLLHLYLNHSQVHYIADTVLHPLINLRILHLDHNRLEEISASVFSKLDKLTSLYLNDNQLSSLSRDIFGALASLQTLDLRRNRLAHFHAASLHKTSVTRLWIGFNDFDYCGCKEATELKEAYPSLKLDLDCNDEDPKNKCLSSQAVLQHQDTFSSLKNVFLAVLVPLLCVVLGTTTFVCVILALKRQSRGSTEAQLNAENVYKNDVVVIYASRDEDLVHRQLLPLLKTSRTGSDSLNALGSSKVVLVASNAFAVSQEWEHLRRRLVMEPKLKHNINIVLLLMPDLITLDGELLSLLQSQPTVHYERDNWQVLLLLQLGCVKTMGDESSLDTSNGSNLYSVVQTSLSDSDETHHVYNAIDEERRLNEPLRQEPLVRQQLMGQQLGQLHSNLPS